MSPLRATSRKSRFRSLRSGARPTPPRAARHVTGPELLEDRILMDAGGGEIGVPLMPEASHNFVDNLYHLLLRRTPAAAEVGNWVDRLQSGATPAAVSRDFLASSEYLTQMVRDGYRAMLGRDPDGGGAAYWLGRLNQGLSDDQFCAGLLSSDEYFARHGSNTGAWVSSLYHDLLGRTADGNGLAFWTHTLAATDRRAVADGVLGSPEGHTFAVKTGYQALLGRPPEDAGLGFWRDKLDHGLSPGQLVGALASAPEFVSRLSAGPLAVPSGGPGRPTGGLIGLVAPSSSPPEQNTTVKAFPGGLAPEADGTNDLAHMAPGVAGAHPSGFSAYPVRYFDGVVNLSFADLQSNGFGTPWGVTRSWTNAASTALGINGTGMVVTQLPHLRNDGGGTLAEVANGTTTRYFDTVSGSYVERYYAQDQLVANTSSSEYMLTDTTGARIRFNDFSTSVPLFERGTFKSYSDAAGNVTSVTSYTVEGYPAEIQRSNTTGGSTVTESFLYAYGQTETDSGLMISATLRRKVDSGSWSTVRKAEYAYYDGVEAHGSLLDLKTAVVKDGSGNVLDTTYYRYYTGETGGYVDGLKFVFRPASYARLVAALGTGLSSLTDTQVAPYADNYFEYDTSQRVTKEVAAAAGGCACVGGVGTFTYAYTSSTNADGMNSWKVKTVETLPDGNTNTVYTNAAGQVMLLDYHDAAASADWDHFYQYDSLGHVTLQAEPSAVSGYDDTKADLLNSVSGNYQYLNDSTGLIRVTDYATTTTATSTTAGDASGYQQDAKVRQGETGTAITVRSEQYIARSASARTIYPSASETAYKNTDGTGGRTTSTTYTWQGTTAEPQTVTTTRPVVSSSQDGPGTADTSTVSLDAYGRTVWAKDADGFLSYVAYDQATGAVTKMIADVDTTHTSDFTGLPSGWSTPSGGGLHLITQHEVDGLGRDTKLTDPLGNITYTVFLDSNYEVRVYAGWNSGTGAPTGPTQVRREDRPGSYMESLTMSAAPHLTGGRPDGTESVSGLQTLARSTTNSLGQVVSRDGYFNLSGLTYSTSTTLGTENTNYYRTRLGYDVRGRQARVQSPTGTISRTVYDGQGRVVSTWVGTNDSPSSGDWSPTNNGAPSNMVKVTENVYDGGGVGDGNLTQVTRYPGGGASNRVNQSFYDWRDRAVARKDGVESSESTSVHRPITYTTFDNLGEATRVQRYDGDGVSITSSGGVPQAPSSSLLRAQTDTSYDDRGRVFRTQVFSVDQSSGSVSTYALTTDVWRDHRGNTLKTAQPGGQVTKTQYDGVRRMVKSFTTDGGGDTSWTDAGNVTGDAVLRQVETSYDAAGNVLLVTTRQRFHDETATGALGDASTAPKARVSYAARYYDLANRPTATADVGTNGGSAYTRPSSVPSRSDTVLVTDMTYNAAGWQDTTTDPRGLAAKMIYDSLRRVTKTVEAYDGGAQTTTTNKTTEFTYDGAGHLLTLQADLPGGAYEQTAYVYGVTTGTGSGVNSNDLLVNTKWPDKSTGAASTSEKETYTVNALGERITAQDRNGNVHTYSFDVVGRQTSDAVTTLGSGVDGAVRRIETAYDTQGNAYLFTSYDASSGGSVVNQVQRAFNGLGQLITEYQSHSGSVNTSTTPKVQYAYTEMAGGANHSRLTSVTYPNGKVLTYTYASGLDSSISRLSSLSDTSGTLESYSYLGLGTVVVRAHSQPGVDLTYVKQSGESNGDAGDPYIGLDRFGRVVDERWRKSSDGSSTDRFKYGYDRDGNRLYRTNEINHSFDELYHANGASNGYDGLNQLAAFARGTLSDANSDGVPDTVTTASRGQSWTVDGLGNFSSVTSDGTAQSRTHNKQNEVTGVGSNTLTFDANGNLTTDETGKQFVYDAWNRLVTVKSGGTTLTSYKVDGLGRRIVENSGTARDLYYSSAWQVLEERVGGAAQAQQVWSPVYVDALVLRDRDADGNSGNGLEERLWVQQDANGNVTGLANGSATVVERDAYDAYGTATVLSASWATLSASGYGWVYFHQGGRLDTASGLYDFRARDFSGTLGRWLEPDPLQFKAGDADLYRYIGNRATTLNDPSGLFVGVDDIVEIAGAIVVAIFVVDGVAGYYLGTAIAPYTTVPLAEGLYDWMYSQPFVRPFNPPPPPIDVPRLIERQRCRLLHWNAAFCFYQCTDGTHFELRHNGVLPCPNIVINPLAV